MDRRVMRLLLRIGLLPFLFGACASQSPRAIAQPKQAAAAASDADSPLIRAPLENDADIAKAIREYYTKYEHRVPMRDGTKLFTVVYAPKDPGHTYPIVLTRTPYSVAPYGIDNYTTDKNGRRLRRFAPSTAMIKEGYIFVHQDVRGRMMSEGTFVDVRPRAQKKGEIDESTDAWDTIDWLVKNVPANNGRVGTWGISYPGFYAAQTAIDAHPALKAVSPQAPVTEWFLGDDFHHNGAFFLADAFDFYGNFGKPRPQPTKQTPPWTSEHEGGDVYDFFLALGPIANANDKYLKNQVAFWNDLTAHGTRDEFWKARDPRPHYKDTKPAVMTVGGWFDAEDLWGALATYRAFEDHAPKNENVLVMGPWAHGGWSRSDGDRHGDILFGQKTSVFYREHIELPFFQRHLKGKKTAPSPEAFVYETGTNVWQRFATWPPQESKPVTLFFHAKGGLGTAPPQKREDDQGIDSWTSDPQKPVPYRAKPGDSIDSDYMSDDQRFAARRPDVLVYSTEALDADVALAGPIEVTLQASTTGTDADFVVKLVDVYPHDVADPEPNPTHVHFAGYQQLVRAEVMRGKFRNGFERAEAFTPNEPAVVRFTLPDVCHTFRTGHKVMIQVQSSWFPLVDRNPQTLVDIYKAKDTDFKVATHRIFRTPDKASSVKISVLRGAAALRP
jgi:uncharacterized protein